MAPTVPPRGVSPYFLLAIGGVFALIVLVFIFAIWLRHDTNTLAPPLREASANNDWVNKFHPRPSASPTPVPRPRVAAWTPAQPTPRTFTPQPVRQVPHAAPTMSQWERERIERYHKALLADVIVDHKNGQVLETPQVVASKTGQSSDGAPITVTPPPPHTITSWTMIYAVLQTEIVSDRASDVLARVSQPVKDSTMSEVLIPAGALLHGWQKGSRDVQQNDATLMVAWDQIQFPNGGTIDLPKAPTMNPEGLAGIDGNVNHHYWQVYGPALLISAITAGAALASRPTYGGSSGYTPEQQAFGAGAEVMGGRAIGQLSQGMNVAPTITVPAGSLLRVLVNHPITFSGAYTG